MKSTPSAVAKAAALSIPIALVATATVALSIVSSPAPIASGADGDFTAIDPARLLDTRTGTNAATIDGLGLGLGLVEAESITPIDVAGRGNVSADASAAMLNITAVNPSDDGFLTVFECDGDSSGTSNLNFDAGSTIANAVLAPIGVDGDLCIFSSAETHILVDVNGFSENGSPVSIASARLTDTRPTAGTDSTIDGSGVAAGPVASEGFAEVVVASRGGVPSDAQAAVLNVTAVNPTAAGFLTVYPCGSDLPKSSNVNFTEGDTVAQTAVVGIGEGGAVCVYSSTETNLVVDVDGYVAADTEPVTITPARLLDSREAGSTIDGDSQGFGAVDADSTTAFEATDRAEIPDDANVVLLSVTAVNPTDSGFLTVYACGGDAPLASNVNFSAGQTVPNFVAIAVSDEDEVCVYSSSQTHLLVDATGYFSSAVVDATTTTTTTTTTEVPTTTTTTTTEVPPTLDSCEDRAALFTTNGSANAALVDPESSAVCQGSDIVVSANGIPDYTYIATSPGDPNPQDINYTFTAEPEIAATPSDIALLGSVAIALNGIPIYGPTEGTGGDVLSLVGALSECGSHNGPTGFHLHLLGTSATTDCIFSAAEVASGPQLLGFAFDGFPIYTGNDQYESSWELINESVFSTDTWSAHTYVEGSGDLDECNGLTDANGDYAYYTTDTFPYILGCYSGTPTENGGGGAGGGGGPGGPPA